MKNPLLFALLFAAFIISPTVCLAFQSPRDAWAGLVLMVFWLLLGRTSKGGLYGC